MKRKIQLYVLFWIWHRLFIDWMLLFQKVATIDKANSFIKYCRPPLASIRPHPCPCPHPWSQIHYYRSILTCPILIQKILIIKVPIHAWNMKYIDKSNFLFRSEVEFHGFHCNEPWSSFIEARRVLRWQVA